MHGQIKMLCNTLGKQPPAGMLQYSQQPTRDVKHKVANVANNTTKANKYN